MFVRFPMPSLEPKPKAHDSDRLTAGPWRRSHRVAARPHVDGRGRRDHLQLPEFQRGPSSACLPPSRALVPLCLIVMHATQRKSSHHPLSSLSVTFLPSKHLPPLSSRCTQHGRCRHPHRLLLYFPLSSFPLTPISLSVSLL